jgi:hypothetical protein
MKDFIPEVLPFLNVALTVAKKSPKIFLRSMWTGDIREENGMVVEVKGIL